MYLNKEILGFKSEVVDEVLDLLKEATFQSGSTPALDKALPVAGRAALRAKSTKSSTSGKVLLLDENDSKSIDEMVKEAEGWFGEGIEQVAGLTGQESYERPNGELYYARNWGDHSDIEVLRKAREAGQFVMLYGSPGTGKTAAVEAAFPDELYTLLGSGDTEVSDLVGSYVQTPSGGFEWIDGVLVKAASEGKVLLIDEVGLIDPKVLSIVYGLMDGRKELVVTANPERGVVKAQEGFYVVAATNPNAAGVRLSEALLSRFTIQAEMTTDWSRAKDLGVPNAAVVAAQNLSKKMENGETSWSPQMRELLAFKKNADLFGTKWAIQNLLASAPEIDRPVAADVFTRVFGDSILPARI
jgi:nitric oxide reductase NorQ protein